MPSLEKLLSPKAYLAFARRKGLLRKNSEDANWRSVNIFPPGHFYSPLLDLKALGGAPAVKFDGPELWENIDLRTGEQKALFTELLDQYPPLPFPKDKTADFRYYKDNTFFCEADAYLLSAVLRKERPRRVVEVGSGFSSAVMLDTLDQSKQTAEITFVDPYPERLHKLLVGVDKSKTRIIEKGVQEVPLAVFDGLQKGDVLFIDSSHVAKVGSDVTFLILRILPRLVPGVWVHVHDIFYPESYPTTWIKEGRAWNESLFLRAYLVGNRRMEIAAFNCYAASAFPEVFKQKFPSFLSNCGGSIWLRTTG